MYPIELLPERFWAKVDRSGECWLWTACISSQGYSRFGWDGRVQFGHRVSYETLVGPVPDGLQLDHLCRVRRCVNPEHLEPVTQAENQRRRAELKTHCPNRHPFSPENTGRTRGWRYCKACKRERSLAYYRERRAA